MNLLGLIALFFIAAKADPAGGFIQKGMHTLLGNRLIENDSVSSTFKSDWCPKFGISSRSGRSVDSDGPQIFIDRALF